MAKHPSSVETTVLEGVTHIELGYPVGAEFDLTDGEVALRFNKGFNVTLAMIGEKLVIITTEPDKVPESKQASYVPRHRTH